MKLFFRVLKRCWLFLCSSVGYSLLCKKEKTITVQPDRIVIGNVAAFGCVLMKDFLEALSKRVKRNPTSFDNYMRMYVPPGLPLNQKSNEPLKTVNLFHHIQVHLKHTLIIPSASRVFTIYSAIFSRFILHVFSI